MDRKNTLEESTVGLLFSTPHQRFYFPNLWAMDTLTVGFFILLGSFTVIQLERYGKRQRT